MIQNDVFYEMFNNPVRELKGRVELYNRDDSSLVKVCDCNDDLQSFKVERVGENKFFGFGIVQKLSVILLDLEREKTVTTDNYLEALVGVDNEYLYTFPAFYVSEVHRNETNNNLSITAYDALYNATKHTVSELSLKAPYTIREFAEACAGILGLPINIESENTVFDLYYENGANFDGTETIREALNAIAEVTQTIYFVNGNWELTFKSLDKDGEAILTINKDIYFSLDSNTNRRLSTICHTTELGDNISASIDSTGTTQYIRENPFLNLREDVGELLQAAIDTIGGFTINQFECQWRGNTLLEIGDKIALETKDGGIVTSYFLNDVVAYDGALSENTLWNYDDNEEDTASNPANIGEAIKQTYAKVDKINRTIELVASDISENEKAISQIKLDTGSITASVESLKTTHDESLENVNEEIATIKNKVETQITDEDVSIIISKELSDGVEKVKTSTGYTFDDNGLTISKSDSEMSTIVSEDGMTVYRNGEEVLIADNEGVWAEDLHATTYLIIGTYSRLEDYINTDGEPRTGCFWVG